MNPEKPSREEIEAKLTALLLGELPAEEAQLLRWAISQDAGLAKLHDRLKFTIGLVREIAANPVEKTAQTAPLKLSDERREKLFAHFKTIAPRKFEPPKRREISSLLAIAAAMAIIALLAALLLPSLAAAKRKAQHLTMLSGSMEKEQVTVAPVAPQAVSERRVESVEANFQNNLQPQTQSPVVTTAPSAITPTQIVLPPSEPNAGVPAQKEELAASGSAPCGVANNFGLAGGGGGASGGDSFGGSTTFQGQLHSINRRVAEGERQDQNR
jgi:type II secretory pathway pseudopilin PulG